MAEPVTDQLPVGDSLFSQIGTPQSPPGDQPAPQFADFMGGATFMPESSVDVRFEYWSGDVVQDVAGKDGSAGDRVKLHAGFWTKVISWDYERLNSWPVCPHPDTQDPNDVLLYATIQPAKPQEGPNGTRVFRVAGEYTYRLLRPLADWGPFPTARSPESTASQADNTMPAFAFERGALSGVGSFQ